MFMNALRKPCLGVLGHMTKMLQGKIGKKVDEFEPIYLGNFQY